MADLIRLSKFLALSLRHRSDKFGLNLDENGFTDITLVWNLIQDRFPTRYTYDDLLAVVDGDKRGKKRYEIQDGRIRALFGHSTGREITYPSVKPPEMLYHGTTAAAIAGIKKEGLQSKGRQYVHMTLNVERAEHVAARHAGESVILTIRAAEAYAMGIVFHHPEPEHFLAKEVPSVFVDFP